MGERPAFGRECHALKQKNPAFVNETAALKKVNKK
jgi:hypothetical protein